MLYYYNPGLPETELLERVVIPDNYELKSDYEVAIDLAFREFIGQIFVGVDDYLDANSIYSVNEWYHELFTNTKELRTKLIENSWKLNWYRGTEFSMNVFLRDVMGIEYVLTLDSLGKSLDINVSLPTNFNATTEFLLYLRDVLQKLIPFHITSYVIHFSNSYHSTQYQGWFSSSFTVHHFPFRED